MTEQTTIGSSFALLKNRVFLHVCGSSLRTVLASLKRGETLGIPAFRLLRGISDMGLFCKNGHFRPMAELMTGPCRECGEVVAGITREELEKLIKQALDAAGGEISPVPSGATGATIPSKANRVQVGGSHYRSPIQHWDYVIANEIPYLEAQIIKYLTRWRKKNGAQDVRKAYHFLQKLMEVEGIHPDIEPSDGSEPDRRYVDQDPENEGTAGRTISSRPAR